MIKAKKVFDLIYIYTAKVQTQQGWVLNLMAMDGYSEYVFNPVFDKDSTISIDSLNQLFDNVLKDYNPIFHSRQITFITNIPVDFEDIIKLSKTAKHHRFIFNKQATEKAFEPLIKGLSFPTFPI